MKLLDLYCGAGGSSVGYARAGFDVTGVDIKPQPRYPHRFIRTDALNMLDDKRFLDEFDVIAASPPCQHYSPLNALSPDKVYPDLIARTRDRLNEWGGRYVIENVMAAPLIKDRSVVLCGEMFGLRTYRHRRFELSDALQGAVKVPFHPIHRTPTATSQRRVRWDKGWHVSITGDVGTYVGLAAMGIDWMNGNELSEAIPPPYTEWIGRQVWEG